MHVKAIDLTHVAIRRGEPEVDETDDLSRLLGDEQGSLKMRITDEAVPHATAAVHGGIEHLWWEELGIADSPSLGVRFANGSAVTRLTGTDHGHSWMMPPVGSSARRELGNST
jgi:hypothetical protein